MNKIGKIAVLGDEDCVLAFRAVGLSTFGAPNKEKALEILRELVKGEYAVIFITEDIALQISDTLEILKSRTFPAIIPIPSSSGESGYGLNSIRKDVEKAIGVDIIFND